MLSMSMRIGGVAALWNGMLHFQPFSRHLRSDKKTLKLNLNVDSVTAETRTSGSYMMINFLSYFIL